MKTAVVLLLLCAAPIVAAPGVGRVVGQNGSAPAGDLPAAAGWFDLPVPGGEQTLASLGIPAEDRGLTLALLARALYANDSRGTAGPARFAKVLADLKPPAGSTHAPRGPAAAERPAAILAPLSHEAWQRALGLGRGQDLFMHLVGDRSALFLAAALMATDVSIRALVTADRDLLRFLHRDASGAFAVAARSLRLADGRVVVPGDPRIWETLADKPVSRPADFIRALVAKDDGRLAWYFDTVAGWDAGRLDAIWPAAAPPNTRLERALALYEAFRSADAHWRLNDQPYRRAAADAWMVTSLVAIEDGRLAGPAWAWLWQALFTHDRLSRQDAARLDRAAGEPVSMDWLAREIVLAAPRERRDRFEMFRLAQRVFAAADESHGADMVVALSGFRRLRGLLLSLERMEVTRPATWAVVVEAARLVDENADGDPADALASFQAAIALLERLRQVRTIDAAAGDRLLRSLAAFCSEDHRTPLAVGRWIVDALVLSLPPLQRPDAFTGKTAYESRILQALGGIGTETPRTVEWEGLRYDIDPAAAERERLRAVRSLLPSPGLDAALAAQHPGRLAAALTALVYAIAAGEAEGPVSLSPDLPTRHDFGLRQTALLRETLPWAPPEERQGLGSPWHAQGGLIGLDLGLSRLALRRVIDQQMPTAPALTLNDFATLTRTVVAMVPSELHDAERDEIAATIARGRERVRQATNAPDAMQQLALEVRLSSALRAVMPWMMAQAPNSAAAMFSVRDLLWLGNPTLPAARLDRWGVYAGGVDGRQVTAMPPPAPWEDFAGRADSGQMTTQLPDLTLRLAEETAALKLPASLVPLLLPYAVQDYWHDTQTRFADDWTTMVRQAGAVSKARIEDYVAALAGNGPLRRPQ